MQYSEPVISVIQKGFILDENKTEFLENKSIFKFLESIFILHFCLCGPDMESDSESWDSYDKDVLGIEECFFCPFLTSSLEDNMQHMPCHLTTASFYLTSMDSWLSFEVCFLTILLYYCSLYNRAK